MKEPIGASRAAMVAVKAILVLVRRAVDSDATRVDRAELANERTAVNSDASRADKAERADAKMWAVNDGTREASRATSGLSVLPQMEECA